MSPLSGTHAATTRLPYPPARKIYLIVEGIRCHSGQQLVEVIGKPLDRLDHDPAILLPNLYRLVDMQSGGGHYGMRNPHRGAIAPLLDVNAHCRAPCIYAVNT